MTTTDAGDWRSALPATYVQRADRERLGEDLRKLYVALTRARYATWVGVAPLLGGEASAVGYLLAGGQPLAPGALAQQLADLRGDCPHIAVAPAPAATSEYFVAPGEAAVPGPARSSRRVLREHWWIASYSALKTVGENTAAVSASAADTPSEAVFQEALAAQLAAGSTALVSPAASRSAEGGRGVCGGRRVARFSARRRGRHLSP
jgi:exodeoxyribonuclease V beta subunit